MIMSPRKSTKKTAETSPLSLDKASEQPLPPPIARPAAPRINTDPNMYTVFLAVAAVAMIIGCVMLYMSVSAYGPGAL